MPLWMPDNDAKARVDSGVASADGLTARQSDESIMLMVIEAQMQNRNKAYIIPIDTHEGISSSERVISCREDKRSY